MSFIHTGGCKVFVEKPSLTHAPDICNCSAYYFNELFGSQPERRICPIEQLWNYKLGGCEDEATVLDQRLCNRKLPWERCSDDTPASVKAQIRRDCIQKGTYSEAVATQYPDDKLPFQAPISVPSDLVLGNLELAAAAFVAGCVITLVLLAIILTMCNLPWVGSTRKGTKSSTKVTKKTKTKKSKKIQEVVTEGDNVSIQYEDIDEELDMTRDQGYKPMFSGAHLQLQGGAFHDTAIPRDTHHVTSSLTVSSSSNSHWSSTQHTPSQQPIGSLHGQPSRPIPQIPSGAPAIKLPPSLPHTRGNQKPSVPHQPAIQGTRGKGPMKLPPRR